MTREPVPAAVAAPIDVATALSPIDHQDGYPALEDLGLIGDGTTAALVARDGAVVWLCVPRFDSEPLFCSLLDIRRGGSFRIAPEHVVEAGQRYEPDSGVLVTELRCPTGLVRITECSTPSMACSRPPNALIPVSGGLVPCSAPWRRLG